MEGEEGGECGETLRKKKKKERSVRESEWEKKRAEGEER